MRNKLRVLLTSKGISVYRFQRDVGVAQRTAYDLVNNPSQIPSSAVLIKICDAYEIQPNEVLEWSARPTESD